MHIDVLSYLGAITRVVSHREHDGRQARVVRASRTYDTTVEDLWDALTNPERLPRWFLPITGDLKVGGRYQLQGNAGGEITRCDPPSDLAVTWCMGPQTSWVNVHLSEDPAGGAHLQLEHVAHVPEEFWGQFGPGAVGVGWDLALLGLALHIETGNDNDAAEFQGWTVGEEGRVFVKGCSDGWGQAAIFDGEDPDAATAAAGRTYAFYTGAPPDGSGHPEPA